MGTYGWNNLAIGTTAVGSCFQNGTFENGYRLTPPSGGSDINHGSWLILDGSDAKGIFSNASTAPVQRNGFPAYDTEFRFKLTQTTNTSFRVGLVIPGASTVIPTNGFYLRYIAGTDTNFMICSDLGSSETCFDTGTAADALDHTFRIREPVSGTLAVSLYSAGGAVQQISSLDEATVCPSGCTFTATPYASPVTPAMGCVVTANSTAIECFVSRSGTWRLMDWNTEALCLTTTD